MTTAPRAIIFDMYGTLCHLKSDPLKEFIKLLPPNSVEQARKAFLTQEFSTLEDMRAFLQQEYRITFLGGELESRLSSIAERLSRVETETALYDDVASALDTLQENGIPIGLISNLATPYKKAFSTLGLGKYILNPVFSCDVGFRKPDRRIYQLACERLGIASHEAVMVGNSPINDIDGARAAGLRAILLSRDNHSPRSHLRTLDELPRYLHL